MKEHFIEKDSCKKLWGFFFPHLDSVLSTLRLPCLVPSNWTNSADFNLLETGEFASDPALETHLQHNSCRCYKFVWQQSFIHISISQICKKISLLPHQLLTPLKPQLPPHQDTISLLSGHNHLGRKCRGVGTCHIMTHVRPQLPFDFVPCWWLLCTAVQIPASLTVSRFLIFAKFLHSSSTQCSSKLFSEPLTQVTVCCASLLCWVTGRGKLNSWYFSNSSYCFEHSLYVNIC